MGLLIVLVAAGFIFFTMISDQIFFKKVNEEEKVEHLNVTLNKAPINKLITTQVNKSLTRIILLGEMLQIMK